MEYPSLSFHSHRLMTKEADNACTHSRLHYWRMVSLGNPHLLQWTRGLPELCPEERDIIVFIIQDS